MKNRRDKNGTIYDSEEDRQKQYGSGAYSFLNRVRMLK